MEPIVYHYDFEFSDGRKERFDINLDGATLEPIDPMPALLPNWAKLESNKCEHCPLSAEEHPYCPLATRLVDLVERLNNVISYDEVTVNVKLGERTVIRNATAQDGISALMGIITATSGCPHTAFLKPMARFHLPFSNTEETLYRAASMYMLAQYFRWQEDRSVDLDLEGLVQCYKDVAEVNRNLAKRLRAEKREDGTVNALILLDMFAKTFSFSAEESLQDLKPLFHAYLS